ncbi:MAG: ABC transporter permease [Ignavibacteriales bacterium]|nr:ABC transporter permease [Ignavibacteriales bacterium]MBK8663466.1 ABC transporter permease [Ignavibacteriales bacterium]MBP9123627.1 ABC transporter permease [Ignavibacteriaceae bacterium]MCC6636519.1 ABC transporter permease [Ignavibacteriaceae bacterium]
MSRFLYELKEGLVIAFTAVKANKIRTMLTTLGIVIGVTSVVLMSTAIKGIDGAFERGISSLGADVLHIDKWEWFSNTDWWLIRKRPNISMEDYEKYKRLAKLPVAVAPTIWSNETVKREDLSMENIFVSGSTAEYLETTNFTFKAGRFYSDIEGRASRYVAVLGSEIEKNLFPAGNSLGNYVKIGGLDFRIVGVLNEQGSFMLGNFNPDRQVFVPIGVLFKHFVNSNFRSVTIDVKAPSNQQVNEVKDEAIGVMRKVRGLRLGEADDFSVNQQEGLMQNYNQTVGVISVGGFFITGLSLFVGAIGIMNIMFVSVKERTREIGVRKAIGAKRRTILMQFLLESSAICLLGGLIGLINAVLLSMLVNQWLPTSVQYDAVVVAIVISLIVGVLAGFAPAWQASKLDPVDALRYE